MRASQPRLTIARIALALGLFATGLALAASESPQQAGAQDPNVREMSDDSAPAAIPPEQRALDAALRITNVSDRLAALEKIRLSYPKSALLNSVDAQVLSLVLEMPDAEDSAAEVIERMLARIPPTNSADARFAETASVAGRLIARKVLLDRAEAMLTTAIASPDISRQNRATGRYQLGRLHTARGDAVKAEAEFRAAAADSPPAVAALVSLYVDRGERQKAESFLLEMVKTGPVNMAAISSLTSLYKAEPARAEAVLRDAIARSPMVPAALLQLARLEQQRGEETGALDHFMGAAALTFLRGPDADALRMLYTKKHGDAKRLEADIDERYRALPPAIHAELYQPTPRRTERLVLIEMFTGSACPPCVAADLAFDAALERYDAAAIVPLAYHVHIPGPDPMTTPETNARREFYVVNGVPTMQVDGAMASNPATGGNLGGGGRDRARDVYDRYVALIDRALETSSTAAVTVRGVKAGDTITITADVTALPAGASDLRLHLVLAEKTLMFGGENGIRAHRMVVRGIAGDKGQGLPLASTGIAQHTFKLAEIREALTRSLASDIGRRRSASAGAPQVFAAEDRAMTTIDGTQLVAVAFVQNAAKKILQASRADVVVK